MTTDLQRAAGYEVLAQLLEHGAADVDPELARLVELRFYAGLSVQEAADALGVSKPTAERRWQVARALLWERLRGAAE